MTSKLTTLNAYQSALAVGPAKGFGGDDITTVSISSSFPQSWQLAMELSKALFFS